MLRLSSCSGLIKAEDDDDDDDAYNHKDQNIGLSNCNRSVTRTGFTISQSVNIRNRTHTYRVVKYNSNNMLPLYL